MALRQQTTHQGIATRVCSPGVRGGVYNKDLATRILEYTHLQLDPDHRKKDRTQAADDLIDEVQSAASSAGFVVTGAYAPDWPKELSHVKAGLYIRREGRSGVYVVSQDGYVEVGNYPTHLERLPLLYDSVSKRMEPAKDYQDLVQQRDASYPSEVDALQLVVEKLRYYLGRVNKETETA